MKRAIISYAEGDEHLELAGMTWPLMKRYAGSCDADFIGFTGCPEIPRPPAWKKLACLAESLSEFDEVLWLDADVVVSTDESIFDDFPVDKIQAVVEQKTTEGCIPNTGVWLCRRPVLPWLVAASMHDGYVNHKWWEQAAVIHLMGYVSEGGLCRSLRASKLHELTHFLDERWNYWSGSTISEAFFIHACGLSGEHRLSVIKRVLNG